MILDSYHYGHNAADKLLFNFYRLKSYCLEKELGKNGHARSCSEKNKLDELANQHNLDTKMISSNQSGAIDNLNELKILRMITKPVYIMAQYVATLESSYNKKEMARDYSCNCILGQENDDFHFCPAHSKYMPSSFCRHHIECNDPIYVCFELAKLCAEFGDQAPEYGEECKNISSAVINFSVNLLQQCSNTEEVKILLREKTGLTKYMRFLDFDVDGDQMFFKYPRLILAAELNYKEFVGHMHCQQILRQNWYLGCEWKSKSLFFKVKM